MKDSILLIIIGVVIILGLPFYIYILSKARTMGKYDVINRMMTRKTKSKEEKYEKNGKEKEEKEL